ncbi:MAG: sulfur carrier protein ThiS [Bacteroidales bacterium]|nr:sulfur carrier protein ThiS [Bacteroidales bacterium]
MIVFINGDSLKTSKNITLSELLIDCNFAEKHGIAIAINNKVVRKTLWNETIIQENDKIIIISATKGG